MKSIWFHGKLSDRSAINSESIEWNWLADAVAAVAKHVNFISETQTNNGNQTHRSAVSCLMLL